MTNKLTKRILIKFTSVIFLAISGAGTMKNARTWLRLGDDACIKATIQ